MNQRMLFGAMFAVGALAAILAGVALRPVTAQRPAAWTGSHPFDPMRLASPAAAMGDPGRQDTVRDTATPLRPPLGSRDGSIVVVASGEIAVAPMVALTARVELMDVRPPPAAPPRTAKPPHGAKPPHRANPHGTAHRTSRHHAPHRARRDAAPSHRRVAIVVVRGSQPSMRSLAGPRQAGPRIVRLGQ